MTIDMQSSEFYRVRYSGDLRQLQDKVFAEVYDDYFGQSSWITTADYDRCFCFLQVSESSVVLDVASGWGAPALRLARETGCSVVGLEINPEAVASAAALAVDLNLSQRVRFEACDATHPLKFPDYAFDAIACFDAFVHFMDRAQLFCDCSRVLKPGGILLFTEQIVTGLISNEEIAQRSPAHSFVISVPGLSERLLTDAGFNLLLREDLTNTLADLAKRHCAARERHCAELRALEGQSVFDSHTQYRVVAERLARERRLSHVLFVAQKAGAAQKLPA
jgi:cyclopropane fatty-acyl-phospholipid synthase-like methyltransferase